MGVTQKQFDDLRAYMERRLEQMAQTMPNPPVREVLAEAPRLSHVTVLLDANLVSGSTALGTIVGRTQQIAVGSKWIKAGFMVESGQEIGVVKYSNTGEWQFVDGLCSQVVESA